jgi:hypothetical protein
MASIEEALARGRPEVCNLATRFLCGDSTPSELPAVALDIAKENLRTFTFVGIQERFEESIVLLQRRLHLGNVPHRSVHVARERPRAEDIPGEQRALILERNRLDAELYAFGLALFDDAVAAADEA